MKIFVPINKRMKNGNDWYRNGIIVKMKEAIQVYLMIVHHCKEKEKKEKERTETNNNKKLQTKKKQLYDRFFPYLLVYHGNDVSSLELFFLVELLFPFHTYMYFMSFRPSIFFEHSIYEY